MFSTKTSRDIEMMPSVSKEHVHVPAWKNQLVENFRNKEYHSTLNNPSWHNNSSTHKKRQYTTSKGIYSIVVSTASALAFSARLHVTQCTPEKQWCRVSENTCACMENPTGGRTPGTRRGTIPCSPTEVNILWHHISKTLDTSPSLNLATFWCTYFLYHQVNSCNWLFLQLWCPLHPSLLYSSI